MIRVNRKRSSGRFLRDADCSGDGVAAGLPAECFNPDAAVMRAGPAFSFSS
jgi:hypothetical protein